jgi:hypothetical protein
LHGADAVTPMGDRHEPERNQTVLSVTAGHRKNGASENPLSTG